MNKTLLLSSTLLISFHALADGNTTISSFNKTKKTLEKSVYFDHRTTIYCDAKFDAKKNITLPSGFESDKHVKRSKRVEWEHIVPAENFGRTFSEWREGNKACVTSKGKEFKGRRCAEKTNDEYRLMQSDMYNLYPAIGSVNAMRSNYNFAMLPNEHSDFGSCEMKIDNKKAEPPKNARGRIARTYMYMESAYPRYKMSKSQRQLMNAWDKQYPVSSWECKRAERIEKSQGNVNTIIKERCN
ncbi:endonuclease [Aliivibrio sifiae]|uniref:Endonuclease n=1 Tax=Aliivibrio sifiae TaxID=566293 RepID=A0A2S7X1S8_9GAMM|nr:endonuclease [Aliivibrio sifiae]PQJ83572.1 endonuclease I [Aliivibrio sifiae]GLR76788.1 endonuclease [Aliivibrio sifiae]